MKIAVTAAEPGIDTQIDPRFGRCQYFIVIDPETMEFESVANASAIASGGAGTSAAQMIADKGVEAVLTGNCGPNAFQVLSAAGINVITGVTGTVKEAVQKYKDGSLKAIAQPNVPDHFGDGEGRGRGRGGGRGMRWR
jgi:predicted Fe-Mo cluster-binding NifX family protein